MPSWQVGGFFKLRQDGQNKSKLVTISDLKESAEASPPSEPDPEEKSATEPVQEDVSVKEVCNLTSNTDWVEKQLYLYRWSWVLT